MNHTRKLSKLNAKIQGFAKRLEKMKDFTVHRNINHFYYMQKATELDMLLEQLDETHQKLSTLIARAETEYASTFNQWSRDLRWLQHYEMASKN